MFVMPQSAGYTSDMEFDAFQPFATPQLRYEQRFVCGQSSDPYGWGVETTSPQHLAARQSETVSSSSMTSSGPALQVVSSTRVHFPCCTALQSNVEQLESSPQAQLLQH